MRVRFAALLTVLLLVPVSGQVAFAADRELGGPAHPEQASQTARERAESALARAQALFEERSPHAARRQLAAHGRDATMVLNEVMRTRADLALADRNRADALLARPTEPGGDGTAAYGVPEATPFCGDTVCVHYVTSTGDAPPLTDGDGDTVPDTVEQALATAESVNDAYVAAGYRRPDPDGGLGGGSDRVDVYLADLGGLGLYGYCTTDQPEKTDGTFNYWAYCAIDEDFESAQFPTNTPLENQQVTLAHEYFHAVQYAYDAFEDPWFLEATATWAEDELFDDVNDNWNYLPEGQLVQPGLSLDGWDQGSLAHYGNWVFFRYLTEQWPAETGGMPTLMLDLLEAVSARGGSDPDRYSTDAIARALASRGTSFATVYGAFADANRRPAAGYDEGAAYPVAAPAATFKLSKRKRSTGKLFTELPHLTNVTARFRPGKGTRQRNWKLRVKVDMPPRATAPVARVASYLKNGKVQTSTIRLNGKTKGSTVVAFSSRKVRHVELVLVNASLRTECWTATSTPLFACFGTPTDDFVRSDLSASIFRR